MALIKKVSKQTAMNPVARAIAKANLRKSVMTQRIAVYLAEEREDWSATAVTISLPLYAMLISLERIGETDSPDIRKLRSGCKILAELAEHGFKWKKAYAVTMDNALEICERRWAGIPPKILNSVINEMESMDA